jgi:CHAT domain-containing protein
MKEKNENRKQYTKEEMKKLFHWIMDNIKQDQPQHNIKKKITTHSN